MSLNPRIVKESFAQIEPVADKAVAYFYGRLFAENPGLRALFPPAMDVQRDRLFHALTRMVWSIDSPDTLATYLSQLGRDHRKFGVLPEHYGALGRALLATIRRFAGDAWSPEIGQAWTAAYGTAAAIMIQAAEADAANAPPWWIAEVVGHELRSPGIAVVTARPGTRLDHVAGQYVTLQTSHWPRMWRPYSIANAPRADGTLRFHIRAVPAGWVSGALVRHAKVGDKLLLGPAMGTMVLDPDSNRDLLCVAGGTGLAPLKAIVEQVVESRQRRNIHLILGARTEGELYDLAELRVLERTYPWLHVTPVLSEASGSDAVHALHGMIPDALGRFGDWADHDVYIAGPAEMIEKSVTTLQELGVPSARINHDPVSVE
jgi:NAD(P)H-flavin reductase/hemoglobin-like flavoprotein